MARIEPQATLGLGPIEPQATLRLGPGDGFRGEDILPAPSNQDARRWLDNVANWPGLRLALCGPAGCGKTHLAHIWAGGEGRLLDAVELSDIPLLGQTPRFVIDRADEAAQFPALLHWMNACAEAGRPLLLIGRAPPAQWPACLPDLASRLRALQSVEIGPPEDELLRRLLVRLLAERQLAVPGSVQDWLLLRLPRTTQALHAAVVQLDRVSLARHENVTRSLARAALGDLLEGG
jgi:chromosomal replication initiation ATPase DnaA